MIMATEQNIELIRGDTEVLSGTVTDSTGTAYNITGYTIKFTVKKRYGDPDTEAIIGPVAGVIVSGAAGTYTVSLTKAQTYVDPDNYVYDVQIYLADNSIIKTVNYGKCFIRGESTKTPS